MTVLMRVLSVTAALVAAIAAAWCYPTLYGDTGLVLVPTADTMPVTYFELAANYISVSGARMYPVRLSYGASDNTEMFVLINESKSHTSQGGFDALGGGFKVALLQEDLTTNVPGIAFGARLVELRGAVSRRIAEGYLVASKTLLKKSDALDETGWTIRIHGCGLFTRYSGGVSENFFTAAGGVSYNNFDGTSVVVDFVPRQESNGIVFRKTGISAAFRRPLSEEFMAELGTTQPFGVGSGGSLYVGILYRYGIREAPKTRKPRIDSVNY